MLNTQRTNKTANTTQYKIAVILELESGRFVLVVEIADVVNAQVRVHVEATCNRVGQETRP